MNACESSILDPVTPSEVTPGGWQLASPLHTMVKDRDGGVVTPKSRDNKEQACTQK